MAEIKTGLPLNDLSYKDQRQAVAEMCVAGNWGGVIGLINKVYDFRIGADYIQATAKIFETRLSRVVRWDRNGGPIMYERDKGTSASHSVQVLLLAGWILSKVPVGQEFKTQIGEMVLVHELGESFGELSTVGNRINGKENGRMKAIKRLQKELKIDGGEKALKFSKKVDDYVSDGVLDEGERANLEEKIGEYVAKKDVGGELGEKMIQRQAETERKTYTAKIHKLIERLETTEQWMLLIKGASQMEDKYKIGSILYLKKPLRAMQEFKGKEKNSKLEDLLEQLTAGIVAGVREKSGYSG